MSSCFMHWSRPELNLDPSWPGPGRDSPSDSALIGGPEPLCWHLAAIVPSFLSSYQSDSTVGELSERHVSAVLLTFTQISVYPSIHRLSSAMSKLHNLQSAGMALVVCTCSRANAGYKLKYGDSI